MLKQNQAGAISRRTIIIIILGLLVLIAGIIIFTREGNSPNNTSRYQEFSNTQFSIKYPSGFSHEVDSKGVLFTPSNDSTDNAGEQLLVTKHLQISSDVSLDSIEKNATTSVTGKSIPHVTTNREEYNDQQALVVTKHNDAGQVIAESYYIFTNKDVWLIVFSSPVESKDFLSSSEDIVNSFTIKG